MTLLGPLDRDGDGLGDLDPDGVAQTHLGKVSVLPDVELLGVTVQELQGQRVLVAVDGKPLDWPAARRLLKPWSSRHAPVLTIRRGDVARLTVLPQDREE